MIGDSNIRINKVRTVAVLKLLKIKILKNNNNKSNDSNFIFYLINPFAFTNCVCIGLAVFAFKALEIPCLFAFSGGKTQKCKCYY